jgi:hypothetical protein
MSLDDDLAAWAATVQLPDAEAAAIFQRIVGTPAPAPPVTPVTPVNPVTPVSPPLDPAWWGHFTADFTARIVSSTRPVRRAA